MSHNHRTSRGGALSAHGLALLAQTVLKGRWARRRAQYYKIVGKKKRESKPIKKELEHL